MKMRRNNTMTGNIHRGIGLGIFFFLLFFSFRAFAQTSGDMLPARAWEKISFDFENVSLGDLVKLFSQQMGVNFLFYNSVSPDTKVSLYLTDVMTKDAFEKLLLANHLDYEVDPQTNIWMIRNSTRPLVKLETRVIDLKHIQVGQTRMLQMVNTGTEANATADLSTILQSIKGEHTIISTDTELNRIIITDVPENLPRFEKLIKELDVLQPQVLIEVEMLDVSKDTMDKLGVSFPTDTGMMVISPASRTTRFPFEGWPLSSGFAKGYNSMFTAGTMSFPGMAPTIDFITKQTDTRYLARPKILTVNGIPAIVKIETQETIGVTTTVSAGTGGTSTSSTAAERQPTGVALKVIPIVNKDTGDVTLYIEPKVSEAKAAGTIKTAEMEFPIKDPETRTSKQVVRIKNGETVMIGGLIRVKEELITVKMPILGDVPFLGAMFRHKDFQPKNRELVVFLTPRIVDKIEGQGATEAAPAQPAFPLEREQEYDKLRTEEMDNYLNSLEKK